MLPYTEFLTQPPVENVASYAERDTVLYALGLGVGAESPCERAELQFVFEDGLRALPTMAVVIATPGFFLKDPRYEVDWRRVLHGEQRLTLHKPLPAAARVRSVLTFDEIYDKGAEKGALLYSTRKLYDEASGDLLATLGSTSFMRGDGGCGGKTEGAPAPHWLPERSPDETVSASTFAGQALIYRLSGDLNPLHADPAIAEAAGFPRPILHGLCTYGVIGRSLLKLLCDDDPSRLQQFDTRFSAPVFPGDEIAIDVWREAPGLASFRARVEERGATVLNNGLIRYSA